MLIILLTFKYANIFYELNLICCFFSGNILDFHQMALWFEQFLLRVLENIKDDMMVLRACQQQGIFPDCSD